jgi:hypothetical protein
MYRTKGLPKAHFIVLTEHRGVEGIHKVFVSRIIGGIGLK